jgi:hypothetical protein
VANGTQRTPADERLERYLSAHGVEFLFEPDWEDLTGVATAKTPDYLIGSPDQRVIAEVKGFTTDRIRRHIGGQKAGVLSEKLTFGPVRSAFADAARQLAPFSATGIPLVIVLANPEGADAMLIAWAVQHALLGNPKFSIPIDVSTGGQAGPMRWIADEYAVALHEKSAHISGVAVIHEREIAADWREAEAKKVEGEGEGFEAVADAAVKFFRVVEEAERDGRIPIGSYTWAEVFELHELHESAPPAIPREMFTGARDRRFGVVASGYGEIAVDRRPGT